MTPRQALHLIQPDLMVQVMKGDQPALLQLYDHTGTVLFSFLYRILGDKDEAAAVLIQLYEDLPRKSLRYDPGKGLPLVWLIHQARTRALERLRTRSGAGPRPDPASWSTGPTGSSPAAAGNLRAQVTRAFSDLPDLQQQALELTFFQGFSHQDAAAALQESPEAIRSAITQGLRSLRTTLNPFEPHDVPDVARTV